MYLIVIAWIYVVLMMSIAEAASSNGSILGALITFVLYGAAPVSLVVYLMGAPARSKAIKKREAEARALYMAGMPQGTPPETASSIQPDAGGHAAGSTQAVAADADASIAPVRKEP
jgi:hypothetical protein